MADKSNKVGSAYVELEARTDEAQADLDSFKNKLNETDGAAEKSTKKITGSFSEMTEQVNSKVQQQIGAVTGLIGAFTAVVGVAGTFVSIGKSVGNMLFANKQRADELTDAVSNLDRALDFGARSQEQFADTIARANEELGRRLNPDDLISAAAIREEIVEVETEIERMLQSLDNVREEAESKRLRALQNQRVISSSDIERQYSTDLQDRERDIRIKRAVVENLKKEADELEGRFRRAARDLERIDAQRETQARRDAIEKAGRTVGDQLIDPLEKKADDLAVKIEALRDLVGDAELGIDAKGDDLLTAVRALSDMGLAEFPKSVMDAERINSQLVDALLKDVGFKEGLRALQDDLKAFAEQIKEENQQLPDTIRKSVKEGVREALSESAILRVPQTLSALQANTDLIIDQIRR